MPLPKPFAGLVIHYSYLWWDEHRRGQEEGRKDRPCVIVAAVTQEGGGVLVSVVPVTHQRPRTPSEAVEIPALTKSRLGLDDQASWILVTERNRFHWPGPDLRSIPNKPPGSFSYGVLPPGLFRQVTAALLKAAAHGAPSTIPR